MTTKSFIPVIFFLVMVNKLYELLTYRQHFLLIDSVVSVHCNLETYYHYSFFYFLLSQYQSDIYMVTHSSCDQFETKMAYLFVFQNWQQTVGNGVFSERSSKKEATWKCNLFRTSTKRSSFIFPLQEFAI